MTTSRGKDGPSKPTRSDVVTLAKGGAVTLMGSLARALSSMLLLLGLGRILGTTGSGAFLEAIAIFNIAAVTATLGVDTGLIKSISASRASAQAGDIRRILRIGYVPVTVVGLAVGLAVALSADQLAEVFASGDEVARVASFLDVMALFIPFGAILLATTAATRGYETMVPTVVVDRVGRLGLQALFVLVALWLGLDDTWLALVWSVPVVLAVVWAGVWLTRLRRRDDGEAPSETGFWDLAREFWAFTLPRAFASIFRVAVLWLDVLLVGALISTSAAGIYAVSTRLLQLGLAVAFAVGQASQPMISRLITAGGSEETKPLYATATAWQMILTWPQYLVIAIFATALLGLFGVGFTEGASVVVILAVSALLGSSVGPVDMVLLMAGKSMWSFWNTAVSLALNIMFNLILIPRVGINGAAIAWAVSRIVGNVLPLVQLGSAYRLHPFGPRWVRVAVLAVSIFGVGGWLFRTFIGGTVVDLVVFGVVSTLVYGLALYKQRDELDLVTGVRALRSRLGRRRASAR